MHCIYMFIWENSMSSWYHLFINEYCIFLHLFVSVYSSVKLFSIIPCLCLVKFISLNFLLWLWMRFNFFSFFLLFKNVLLGDDQLWDCELSEVFRRQPAQMSSTYLLFTFYAIHCDTCRQGSDLMGLFF